MSSRVYSLYLPLVIVFVSGCLMILDYFVPTRELAPTVNMVQAWTSLVTTYSIFVGVAALVIYNAKRLYKKTEEYWLSILSMAVLLLYILIGTSLTPASSIYQYLYTTVTIPLNLAISSILSFYMTSAAYRALRARTIEGVFVMLAVVLVVFGQAPVGGYVSPNFDFIKDWLLNVPNAAGQRAILIGIAIGSIVLGIRVLLGLERSHFRRQ